MDKKRISRLDTKKEIGERVKWLRKKNKLSQEEFAELLDISYRTVGRIERGDKALYVEEAVIISDYFNISCDELLRGQRPEYYEIEKTTGLKEATVKVLKQNIKKYKHYDIVLNMLFSIDQKEIGNFLTAIYLYASTYLYNIKIDSSSIISRMDNYDDRIKKMALWSAFEPYVKSTFETIRENFTDKIEMLEEDEINNMLADLEVFRKEAENEVRRFDNMREDEQMTPEELEEDIKWEKEYRNDY